MRSDLIPVIPLVSSHHAPGFCKPASTVSKLSGSLEGTLVIVAIFAIRLLLTLLKMCNDFRSRVIKAPREEEAKIK